eukprot:gene1252-1579_t
MISVPRTSITLRARNLKSASDAFKNNDTVQSKQAHEERKLDDEPHKSGCSIGLALVESSNKRIEFNFYEYEKRREVWEYDNYVEGEQREMVELYCKKGMPEDDAQEVVGLLSKYKELFVDIMMTEELNLLPVDLLLSPKETALSTLLSFEFFGLIPLTPFFISLIKMYGGGDDVSAIVLDVGTFSTKGGYAGEDTPKAVFPTDIGVVFTNGKSSVVGNSQQGIGENQDIDQNNVKKTYYIGTNSITYKRPNMDIINPLQDGLMLSSFSNCKPSALVIDSGGGMTSVVPVHDGYVIKNAIVKSNLAGNRLTEEYYKVLSSKNITINPMNLIKRVEGKLGEFVSTEIPGLTSSYKKYLTLETIRDLKETSCRVSDSQNLGDDINIAGIPYELPDGNQLDVGSDRFQIPELLFNPTPLNNIMNVDNNNNNVNNEQYIGLAKMVLESLDKSDSDIKKELLSNLVLAGGNTAFTGFQERLVKDISDISYHKAKVVSSNREDRKNSVWIGGSILGSLGSFQQMWMSKTEWEEYGRPLVEKKCP